MAKPDNGTADNGGMFLICDLDGTLLKNDFFIELLLRALVHSPLKTVKHLLKGLVYLKHQLLDDYDADINVVLNKDVTALIENKRSSFKKVILISASTDVFTKRVADKLGVFDASYGTVDVNLKGERKLDFIKRSGFTPFVYIGDAKADNTIFAAAQYYYIVKNKKPILVK